MAKKKTVKKKPALQEVSGKVGKAESKQSITDIFSGLKGMKKKKPVEKTEGEEVVRKGKGAWVSGPHKGYINAGGNVASGKMSIQDAKVKAVKIQSCLGFTFEGKPGKDGKVMLWLKNKYPPSGVLSEPNGGWTTYKVENREQQGDSFMDLRGEGSSAKVKTTKDGFRVMEADTLTMDEGGFTKDCPFDCDCCF